MHTLLTFDLLLVLVIVGLLIVTVSCAVLERPPAPGRYYQIHRQTSIPIDGDDVAFTEPIQL